MHNGTFPLSAMFEPHLSRGDLKVLLARSRSLSYRKREPIFSAGEVSENALLITKGQVKLFRLTKDGREVIFRFSIAGEIIGLAELLSDTRRETCAEAQLCTEVRAIPRQAIMDFLQQYPEAAMRTLGVLSARVRALEEALTNRAADSVEVRLLRLLDSLALCGLPQADGRIRIDFPYTHQDVANQIGASRQTVSTIFSDLRRRGLVEKEGRQALFVPPGGLERESWEDAYVP